MTWRERIAAARERGRFTEDDRIRIQDYRTCMVGECSAPLGENAWWQHDELRGMGVAGWPDERSPGWAINTNDFDLAEQKLDAIEDHVLQLKRGDA